MTYSELLAAIDLYAMENAEHAGSLRRSVIHYKDHKSILFVKDHDLLPYLPSEDVKKHDDFGAFVWVNWTPDPP